MNAFSRKIFRIDLLLFIALICSCSCKKNVDAVSASVPPPIVDTKSTVQLWLTDADQANRFNRQNITLNFDKQENKDAPTITVDSTQSYQTIDGFGYSLTGGSAYLLNGLAEAVKTETLNNIFQTDSNSIGVSYLRISIGSSDLDANVFSYDDLPNGQTDVNLDKFSIDADKQNLIPILKQILSINPNLKIMASPWSAPSWMKSNNASKGGSLKPEYYSVYANYLAKYILAMKAQGIQIEAITPQNEPLNPHNNPSMTMTALEQANFIKNNLGPTFKNENINTKIMVYDHNADVPEYPTTILADADAAKYVDGSAFHLYAGSITALSQVHNAYPNKNLYFTEQYTPISGSFSGDLKWHITNLIIGATRNWSRNVLEWNLASDPNLGPHTNGGCTTCLGALTIGPQSTITRNVSYYIIAHASKFVRPGSIRIASTSSDTLPNVAFITPDGKKVLIVANDSSSDKDFNIAYKGNILNSYLKSGSVATFVW
ncbi:MAG: glucosylceramidase [Sphingobacteriales bacterium]|nr:glucosylceramidase [Sphingobacteriales bacterium]